MLTAVTFCAIAIRLVPMATGPGIPYEQHHRHRQQRPAAAITLSQPARMPTSDSTKICQISNAADPVLAMKRWCPERISNLWPHPLGGVRSIQLSYEGLSVCYQVTTVSAAVKSVKQRRTGRWGGDLTRASGPVTADDGGTDGNAARRSDLAECITRHRRLCAAVLLVSPLRCVR